ncbi:MAG: helix-turn-helix transcriptional regulator [Coriobacteriaceae bacterium]|nr:helix-turn-helix transcriptional regulator [Coriobacteriaceae bacterium]
MAIIIRLDVMLARRKMSSLELSRRIGLTPVMLSRIKTGRVKGIKFSTLELMCKTLRCGPGDILDLVDDDELEAFDAQDDSSDAS